MFNNNQKINQQNGFTLIELIISMLIFAIISLISYNALKTYTTNQKLSFEHFDKINALQKTSLFVKRDINQLFNQTITLNNDGLAFKSLQNDTIIDVRYLVKDDNLLREEVLGDDIIKLTLIKNIKKPKFRLLNSKDKWLDKYDIKTQKKPKKQHIKAVELSFEHNYWGKIKQQVMIGE